MAAKLFACVLSLGLVVALTSLTFADEQVKEDPWVEFKQRLEVAQQMVRDGEIAEGIKALNDLAEESKYAPAYMLVGQSFEDLGDYDFAIGAYSRAITAPGSNVLAAARLRRGKLFLKQGMYAQALDDFTQVLELDPVNSEAHYGRGRALLESASPGDRVRRAKTAIESFDRAIRFDGNLALAYYERGMAKAILGHESEAAEDLDQALSLAKDDDAFLRRLVDLTVRLQADNESLRTEIATLNDEAAHQSEEKDDAVRGISEMADTLREIRDLLRLQTASR